MKTGIEVHREGTKVVVMVEHGLWDEILAVRRWAFPPDMEVVMVLAREAEYVNIHNNCFHLWQSLCGREGR